MLYFRKNVQGEWKIFKISKDESDKIVDLTIKKCVKLMSRVEEVCGEGLSAKDKHMIFKQIAPTYHSIASDILDKRITDKIRESAVK